MDGPLLSNKSVFNEITKESILISYRLKENVDIYIILINTEKWEVVDVVLCFRRSQWDNCELICNGLSLFIC